MPHLPSCLALVVILSAATAAVAFDQPQQEKPPSNPTALQDGATLFHEKGCEHCHGPNLAGVEDKGPRLLGVGARLKAEAIEKQILNGGEEMPSFRDDVEPDELAALVHFLGEQKQPPEKKRKR